MTLYEYLKINQNDYDVYDDYIDESVTVCFIDDKDIFDDYDRFCIEIIKKVEVVRQVTDYILVCRWSNLIKNNMEKFRDFTEKYWNRKYRNNEDEFIYQWLRELNYYMSGYVSDNFYGTLLEFVDSLE